VGDLVFLDLAMDGTRRVLVGACWRF